MNALTATPGCPALDLQTGDEPVRTNPSWRRHFRARRPNALTRIAAWSIDVSITGVLATALSRVLGNDFQDPLIGPISLYMLCGFVYGTVMEGSPLAATLGKRLFGLRVVRIDGRAASYAHAAWRNMLRALLFVSAGLSYLIAFLHPQGATLHDLASFTRVVRHKEPAPEEASAKWRPAMLGWTLAGTATLAALASIVVVGTFSYVTAISRGETNRAFELTAPFREAIEKHYAESRAFPRSIAIAGSTDLDLLPNSGWKAVYMAELGMIAMTQDPLDHVAGVMVLRFRPSNPVAAGKALPTWTCSPGGRLHLLLMPTSCTHVDLQLPLLGR